MTKKIITLVLILGTIGTICLGQTEEPHGQPILIQGAPIGENFIEKSSEVSPIKAPHYSHRRGGPGNIID